MSYDLVKGQIYTYIYIKKQAEIGALSYGVGKHTNKGNIQLR